MSMSYTPTFRLVSTGVVSCHCQVAPFAGYQRVHTGADAVDLGPIPMAFRAATRNV